MSLEHEPGAPPAPPPAPSEDAASVRGRILATVSRWLDELAVEDEPPPAGIAPGVAGAAEPPPDLMSLIAALTRLAGEVRVQGRTFDALRGALEPVIATAASRLPGDGDGDGDSRPSPEIGVQLAEARRAGRESVLGALLDVRDRFDRSLEASRRSLAALRPPRAWFTDRAALAALIEGVSLSRDRLDEMLRDAGVYEIEIQTAAEPFDPRTMRAVHMVPAGELPPGTVVEVNRAGFMLGDRLLRAAEVTVAPGFGATPSEVEGEE